MNGLATMSLGRVEDLYRDGRVSQDEFEAYMFCWAVLSPSASQSEWRTVPTDPAVVRIARELLSHHGRPVVTECLSAWAAVTGFDDGDPDTYGPRIPCPNCEGRTVTRGLDGTMTRPCFNCGRRGFNYSPRPDGPDRFGRTPGAVCG